MGNTIVQVFRLLSESLIYEFNSEHTQNIRELCANFIVKEYGKMAFIYRAALKLIVIYFNSEPFLKYKKVFTKLPIQERVLVIKKWQSSKMSFKRQFIKLILNLTLLAYYDSEEVTDRLGIDRETYLRILSFYAGVTGD